MDGECYHASQKAGMTCSFWSSMNVLPIRSKLNQSKREQLFLDKRIEVIAQTTLPKLEMQIGRSREPQLTTAELPQEPAPGEESLTCS